MRPICLTTLFVVFLNSAQTTAFGQTVQSISGQVVGSPQVVFDSSIEACGKEDFPDAPARAFRTSNGEVSLLATHAINRRLLGSSLLGVRHKCEVIFRGGRHGRPELYDDYGWIASTFTLDGRTIYSLVHNEFHGNERPVLCPSRTYRRCWENSIALAISRDGGGSFERMPGAAAVVAAPPQRYAGDRSDPVGYFNPTNIVAFSGHYYAMFSMIQEEKEKGGVCLMRTNDLGDPASWRGYDGAGFSVRFHNPYQPREDGAARPDLCAPIGKHRLFFSLGSLSWLPQQQLFVLTMRLQPWDSKRTGGTVGAYIATSRDLLDWSEPSLLLADRDASPDGRPQLYPAMLDPEADDLNFQNITDSPLLYTIEIDRARGNAARRLLARRVKLSVPGSEAPPVGGRH